MNPSIKSNSIFQDQKDTQDLRQLVAFGFSELIATPIHHG
jgi:hypothetical protein